MTDPRAPGLPAAVAAAIATVTLFASCSSWACETLQQDVRNALAKAPLVERVMRVRVRDFIPQPESKLVDAEFEINMSFTIKLMKRGIERAMADGYAAAMTAGCSIVRATMEAQTTLVDRKGNRSLAAVYGTSLRGEEAVDVNWKNRAMLNWPKIWTVYRLHPAFR